MLERRLLDRKAPEGVDEFDGLVVRQAIGSALAGCLYVELLEHLYREREVPGREDLICSRSLCLLLGVARDRVEQDVGVSEPHAGATRRDRGGRGR